MSKGVHLDKKALSKVTDYVMQQVEEFLCDKKGLVCE